MKLKIEFIVMMTLVVCAVITTGVVLRREYFATLTPRQPEQHPVLISHLRDDLPKGVRLGPEAAPVQLIEFADFECPFCGNFHKTLKLMEERYPDKIGLTFIQFPIPGHRFALLAARVAECAGDQGRFEAMHDQLFEGQDQFGLKPWDDYATAAGVPNMAMFDTCIKKTDPIPRVEQGKELGTKIHVRGTPTIVINGWKLAHPPTEKELDVMVKQILAGKPPVDQKS